MKLSGLTVMEAIEAFYNFHKVRRPCWPEGWRLGLGHDGWNKGGYKGHGGSKHLHDDDDDINATDYEIVQPPADRPDEVKIKAMCGSLHDRDEVITLVKKKNGKTTTGSKPAWEVKLLIDQENADQLTYAMDLDDDSDDINSCYEIEIVMRKAKVAK